jgi:hypothetical protein
MKWYRTDVEIATLTALVTKQISYPYVLVSKVIERKGVRDIVLSAVSGRITGADALFVSRIPYGL